MRGYQHIQQSKAEQTTLLARPETNHQQLGRTDCPAHSQTKQSNNLLPLNSFTVLQLLQALCVSRCQATRPLHQQNSEKHTSHQEKQHYYTIPPEQGQGPYYTKDEPLSFPRHKLP